MSQQQPSVDWTQEQEVTESSTNWMKEQEIDLIRWEGEGGAFVRFEDTADEKIESPPVFIEVS